MSKTVEFYFDLGVTRQITEYGAVALKDNIFVPNSEIWAHNLIRGLKEYSWSPQNTALGNFSAEQAKTTELDDLFLLGRNILQAAEGRSFRAQDFIEHFMQHTADLPSERRKGILDGILFEMFFDANGTFRSTRKLRCFNQAFALQKFEDLAASFDFLSAALAPHQQHFHVVPGRGRPAAIDIRLQDDPQDSVADISFGGGSILRPDGRHEGEDPEYRRYARAAFEELLSHQLMIPQHDLTIAYSVAIPEAIRFPYGHTVER